MAWEDLSKEEKRKLTEADVCRISITPRIIQAGWDSTTQIREQVYFTDGAVQVRGNKTERGEPKKADYILSLKPNIPIAIVEAKKNKYEIGEGMQQGLEYAEILDVPFVFSSNGDAFKEHDRTGLSSFVERTISLEEFPSPEDLWSRYKEYKGLASKQEKIVTQDYYDDGSGREPRYYQVNAINRTIEAISKGSNRILLTMATGSGKTYTAFQIIWRLWKSKTKKRILFLADRNILIDDPRNRDFKPFKSAMTKVSKRQIDKSYEIYLCLYQAVTGTNEEKNIYKQFSPDFFDLVIIDECHRGSASADSSWRQVLEYFTNATQIGLTATPNKSNVASNINYFGEPKFSYSLKQGIEDGFLAPYKVVRYGLDKDLDGWRPEPGQLDDEGQLIEDREYTISDFDRNLILKKRTRLVAQKITEFLKSTDRFSKTIVFCEDTPHAERMREEIANCNPDLAAKNRRYVMRITGNDPVGKSQLENFMDPESIYPVIACTSKLMTTGVDTQTCKLIVIDKNIASLPEFKQIIGRGTRIKEDYKKMFFTIMDFRDATRLFSDPDWDGDPIEDPIDFPPPNPNPPDPLPPNPTPPEPRERTKYFVKDVEVTVRTERVSYIGADGNLITESLKDYSRKTIRSEFASLDEFLTAWGQADQKQAVIDELAAKGVFFDALEEQVGKEYGAFDLLCHVAFDQPPLTRKERAKKVKKKNVFGQYGEQARAVLEALLMKYADSGIKSVESMEILKLPPISKMGTPIEIINHFGDKASYLKAVKKLETALYEESYK